MSSYKGNVDTFFENIKSSAIIELKSFLDNGNNKLIRMNAKNIEDFVVQEYELNENTNSEDFNDYLSLQTNNQKQYYQRDA